MLARMLRCSPIATPSTARDRSAGQAELRLSPATDLCEFPQRLEGDGEHGDVQLWLVPQLSESRQTAFHPRPVRTAAATSCPMLASRARVRPPRVRHPPGVQQNLDVDLVIGGVDAGRVVDEVGVDAASGRAHCSSVKSRSRDMTAPSRRSGHQLVRHAPRLATVGRQSQSAGLAAG
jgi:hypothetical protein